MAAFTQRTKQWFKGLIVAFENGLNTLFETANKAKFVLFFFGLGICGLGVLVCSPIWPNLSPRITFFTGMELSAVYIALFISTWNYGSTIQRIQASLNSLNPASDSVSKHTLVKERAVEQLFTLFNIGLFVSALFTVTSPLWHIFCIQTIYFFFFLNNYAQITMSINLWKKGDRKRGVERALDHNHWLMSENGPAVLGYLAILTLVVLLGYGITKDPNLTRYTISLGGGRSLILLKPEWAPVFVDMIKALMAGVAGYHIALSTAGFFFGHRSSATNLITYKKVADLIENDSGDFLEHVQRNVVSLAFFLGVVVAFIVSAVGVFVAQGYIRW